MAKSSYEKALQKYSKEAERQAKKQMLQNRASSIVNGQKTINGFRTMDLNAEKALQEILAVYDGNESRHVFGDGEEFSEQIQASLSLEFEKLSMYGMISNPMCFIGGNWDLYLTEQGVTYFDDKKRVGSIDQTEEVGKRKQYDVFISHANADKSSYVDDLYMVLRKLGISIFYDSDALSWGDEWKKVILDGTNTSEFAIIVISENFFDREWTERELHEFLKRQNEDGQKIVLPLLHNITMNDLKAKYPELADIQTISSKNVTKEEVAILLAKELIKRYR